MIVTKGFTEPSERFSRLRMRILKAVPQMCADRARAYTESYRETDGEAMIIRRAKALAHTLDTMTIFVADDDLFVGNQASTLRGVPVYPESEALYMMEEMDLFPTRANDRIEVPAEVRRELMEDILPYWQDKNTEFVTEKRIPQEAMKVINVEHQVFSPQIHQRGSLAHTIAEYDQILKLGFRGVKTRVQKLMDALDLTDADNVDKKNFYEAEIICCDAAIRFAERYAALLAEKAAQETDETRKRELEQMCANCRRVPAEPAETFYEALQSFWFTHLILYIEQNGLAISVGRFDQFLYPYLRKDLDEGILTVGEAQEYLDVLWVKFTEIMRAYDLKSSIYYGGFSISENLLIGGVDAKGHDATNLLSFMCLDAENKAKLSQPNISVRVHPGTPRAFLKAALDVVKSGGGKPQLFNDQVAVPMLMECGASLADARDYKISGCVEAVPPGAVGVTNACMSNLGKAFELAMNNGDCLICGEQIGIRTGDAADFTSMEDVLDAFRAQVEAYVRQMVTSINVIERVHGEMLQLPFTSMTLPDCIAEGRDLTNGGARYSFTGPQGVGLADVVDSLAAIEQVIFTEKKATMAELVEALRVNFEGHERLRMMLKNAPKYGNDDDSVDKYANVVSSIYCEAVSQYRNAWGGLYRPGLYPVSADVPLGEVVGALPCGRQSGLPLADGISPEHYMDLNGPTSVMKSASKLDHTLPTNGTLLNQKFSPSYLNTDENINKVVDSVISYFNLGGWHLQFNVVSADVLKAAQEKPEDYPGLLVRVAGYSAFFSELSKIIQDDIIERTEFASM